MPHTSWFGSAACALFLLIPVEGFAAAPMASARGIEEFDPTTTAVVEDHGPPMAAAPLGEQRPTIGDNELDDLRGGQSVVIANQTMQALSAGNSVYGDITAGAVNVADNALSNFSGLGNIMINTGSQVNLQSGMNITINVHP